MALVLEPMNPSFLDRLTYAVLRVGKIECTLEEVTHERYPLKSVTVDPVVASDHGIGEALDLAIRLEETEQARRTLVQDKAKWLFTLATGLLTLFAGLVARRPSWLLGLALLLVGGPLLLATLLLLRFFGIGKH